MAAMKWEIFALSATVSCFVVLLLALTVMIFKYRNKLRKSSYSLDSQTVKLQPCVSGTKKPYIERLIQYLLGYSEVSTEDDEAQEDEAQFERRRGSGAFVKMVSVQPSSDSDLDYHSSTPPYDQPRTRTQSVGNGNKKKKNELQIDSNIYRGRAYTDTPSPEGKSGIWRARESVFFKHARGRRPSYEDESSEGRRSPVSRCSPTPDRRSKLLLDETRKVTGKPPLSPKVAFPHPPTPSRSPLTSFNPNARRNSAAMILEKSHVKNLGEMSRSGISASLENFNNLTPELGSLEVSLYYNADERLLKVCVLDVHGLSQERSLVDSYIKVAFYLFEKPYKNEMQLWSDSAKSLVKRTFSYLVRNVSDLQRATLKFTLFRKNSFVRSKILGKAILRLCGQEMLEAQAYTIKLEHSITELHGELLVSVCHQATAGLLRVGIIRAMSLAKTMRKTMGAPFVIVELRSSEEVLFISKTKQKSNKINPLFDETFEIPVSTDSRIPMDDFHLHITVFRYTFSGSNDVVGMIRLETNASTPTEGEHWKEVTLNPHTTVMKWHKLRTGPA